MLQSMGLQRVRYDLVAENKYTGYSKMGLIYFIVSMFTN